MSKLPDVIRSQRSPYGSSSLGAGTVHHINKRPLHRKNTVQRLLPSQAVCAEACERWHDLALGGTERPSRIGRATSRAHSMKRLVTGLIVLSFNIIVPIGHGTSRNFTGNTFIVDRLAPSDKTDAGSIARNRPLLAKASNS
jgi:hypothetical protein